MCGFSDGPVRRCEAATRLITRRPSRCIWSPLGRCECESGIAQQLLLAHTAFTSGSSIVVVRGAGGTSGVEPLQRLLRCARKRIAWPSEARLPLSVSMPRLGQLAGRWPSKGSSKV